MARTSTGQWDPDVATLWYEQGTCTPYLGRATQVVLLHRDDRGQTMVVGSWRIPGPEEPAIETSAMVGQIEQQATLFAKGSAQGVQRFIVQMHHLGSEGAAPVPWDQILPFWMGGEAGMFGGADGAFGFTEPPTERGKDGMMMRHTEVLMDKFLKMTEITVRVLGHQVTTLSQRLEYVESRHWDTVALYEDLIDRRQERELKNKAEDYRQAKMSKLFEVLYHTIPIIGAKLAGIPALAMPKSITQGGPAMDLVRAIMMSLKEEQLPALQELLSMEQMMALMELHGLVAAEAEEQKKQRDAAAHMTVTSRDDIPRHPVQPPPPPSAELGTLVGDLKMVTGSGGGPEQKKLPQG